MLTQIPPLSARHTFEGWERTLVGGENALAHAAVLAFARRDRNVASPFGIAGASGAGKSHHLRGLLVEWNLRSTDGETLLMSGEAFVTQCRDASGFPEGWPALRARLRSLALLAIDDLEPIRRSPTAQLELVHTIETLQNNGGKLAYTTIDAPARWVTDSHGWQPRLADALRGGLVVVLEPPGETLRRRYVLQLLEAVEMSVTADAIDVLVDSTEGYRAIDGYINQLRLRVRQQPHSAVGVAQVLEVVAGDPSIAGREAPDVPAIIRAVAAQFSVRADEILGMSRNRRVVGPRHLAIYLARERLGASYAELGRQFGDRDPKTIRHACEIAARRLARDPRLAALAECAFEAARSR